MTGEPGKVILEQPCSDFAVGDSFRLDLTPLACARETPVCHTAHAERCGHAWYGRRDTLLTMGQARRNPVIVRSIVNADDLGMSPEINEAIFDLVEMGRVTSATVLANGPTLGDVSRRANDFRRCSLGVHLNATQFEPLSGDKRLAPLLDEDGCFATGRIREIPIGRRLLGGLAREFSCQIERLRELGLAPSHIDSHHDVHTIPALFPVVKWLQRRHSIRKVRIARNLYRPDQRPPRLLRLKKTAWNLGLRMLGPTRTTSLMGSLEAFVEGSRFISRSCAAEIVVHPGHLNFREEERALRTEWWLTVPVDVRPITYHEL